MTVKELFETVNVYPLNIVTLFDGDHFIGNIACEYAKLYFGDKKIILPVKCRYDYDDENMSFEITLEPIENSEN